VSEGVQVRPQTSSLAMLRTLGGIAMISGFLVVLVFQWTKPIIAENKRIAIEKAVFRVVPNAVSRRDFILAPEGLSPVGKKAKGETVYAAYNAKGELQGVALETVATGYQDVIRILYGYDPQCECVTGIKVLKMTETPGLGDKIAYDPDFLKNFHGLDGKLSADKSGLAHPIAAVKHGSKSEPWQIDSISGATISSKAIGRMINASGQRMFPLIQRYLSGFRPPVTVAAQGGEPPGSDLQ
jgi:electron transport complex protein RnfG